MANPIKLTEEQTRHLEEFVEELEGYIRKDSEEDSLYRSSPEFLEEVRRKQHGLYGGTGIYVFEFEGAPIEGELSLRRDGAIINLYHKPGWVLKEPVEKIAEKHGTQTAHMHGFYTFAFLGIPIFPKEGSPLTIEQLIKEYIHTLHMAANELDNIILTNRPS